MLSYSPSPAVSCDLGPAHPFPLLRTGEAQMQGGEEGAEGFPFSQAFALETYIWNAGAFYLSPSWTPQSHPKHL